MRKAKASKNIKRRLQMLLIGGSEQDFARLRELLAERNDGQVLLAHAASSDDVPNQLAKGRYDLLLCSHQSTDVAAFQLLRQVRQHDSRIPIVFLGESINKSAIEAALQAGACATANKQPESCGVVTVRNAFEDGSAEHQHQQTEETLR